MKTRALCFTLILLGSLILSTFTTVSIAQTPDYSQVDLPDGAIVRLGKGGVSYEDRGIAFSPDGSRLVVATTIGVWLYDTETFDELALLTAGHTGEVTAVAFSPDGTKIAAGLGRMGTGTLELWDVETGRNIAIFQPEKGGVYYVAFSPDGTKIAGAGSLWDVKTRQKLDILQDNGVANVTFSPNGRILAGTGIKTFPRTSINDVTMHAGIVKLYNFETGQLFNTLIAGRHTK